MTLTPELKSVNVNERLRDQLIGILFLYKYGGVFVDSSQVPLKNELTESIEKLKNFEFIAYGCDSSRNCSRPFMYVMTSRPKRI